MAEETKTFTAASYQEFLKDAKQLMGIRCRDCGNLAGQARPMCPACHSSAIEWHRFSGKAHLSTFTCISIVPAYMAAQGYGRDNPYCTGVVTLEEGPRISARILGVDGNNPQDIKAGMDLVLDLEELDPEHPCPTFRPA
ncbi:MAG: hypothetical protein BZY88_12355 [SAR202 cluster bacterium Io17-Chloro-G9]|nr:MAG: hypothetical protein BZY88_12355 [SAR202 cluster bacterium Io17-Chloro-G9]